MMTSTLRTMLAVAFFTALSLQPAAACAVCYGDPAAPMSRGLDWAIVALAGIVGVVLSGVVAFFVHIGRRSTLVGESENGNETSDSRS